MEEKAKEKPRLEFIVNAPFTRKEKISLPEPTFMSNTSIENALLSRRSMRIFKPESLSIEEISQLAWAAQGVNDPRGFRTSPSAGAFYPINLYIVTQNVENLPKGIYKYKAEEHELIQIASEENASQFFNSITTQYSLKNPAAIFIFSAKVEQIIASYGSFGKKFLYMEAGHTTQNLYLQTTSLEIGTTMIGGVNEKEIRQALNMSSYEHPLCMMPVGKK